MERVRQELEAFEERIAQRFNVDEKSVRALVRAFVGQEFAKLHSIVMEEITRVRAEFEERLARLGIDPGLVEKIVNEVSSKLLNEIDKRFMHVLDAMNEVGNMNKDVLDLVSEILRAEVETEETLSELRNMLSEERIEELIYRVLVRKGVLKRRRRKWVPLVVGLGILATIVTGLLLSPIVTLVILFIVFVVLMRW